jgi:hypothetical protein
MSVSHTLFSKNISFWIIFTFQCSVTSKAGMINQDSERS